MTTLLTRDAVEDRLRRSLAAHARDMGGGEHIPIGQAARFESDHWGVDPDTRELP